MVLDELGGEADGVLRSDGAVGPDFEHELFVVGHLAQARGFDGVVHFAHRRVDRVHRDVADGEVFVEVAVGADVAAAVFDAHFELQLAAFADRGDVDGLVEDGEIGVFFDHGRGDHAGNFGVERDGLGLIGIELERHLLQVEDDVRGVFDDAGDGAELVQHAFDLARR